MLMVFVSTQVGQPPSSKWSQKLHVRWSHSGQGTVSKISILHNKESFRAAKPRLNSILISTYISLLLERIAVSYRYWQFGDLFKASTQNSKDVQFFRGLSC